MIYIVSESYSYLQCIEIHNPIITNNPRIVIFYFNASKHYLNENNDGLKTDLYHVCGMFTTCEICKGCRHTRHQSANSTFGTHRNETTKETIIRKFVLSALTSAICDLFLF